MYIKDQDLDPMVGAGGAFEALVQDLLRSEAWICGLRQDQIDWDYRTNVGDGGRDVLIRVGNSHPRRTQFIPGAPSVWSVKSGRDGLDPSTLRTEVRTHPKVLEHLKQGGVYCWCTVAPADNDDTRDRLRQAAADLATELGFPGGHIIFFFRDSITAWLKLHPGLIPIHLPVRVRWNTLTDWRSAFKTQWVAFGNRAELVSAIRQHLLATSGANVLHLAGLSGIGKTRTALEACLSDPQLQDVLYFPNPESFNEVEYYLTRFDGSRAVVVIDEVELADWDRLTTRLADYEDRIRVLTIGPAARGRVTAREGVLEVPPPDGPDQVTQVIRAADPALSTDSARDIADWCDHDLRLALLLVQAHRRDPDLRNQPISSVEDVWDRILTLFPAEVAHPATFRDWYAIASLCIDVGNLDRHRVELEYLAKHFGRPDTDFDDFIGRACNCGLGGQHGSFFEAGPRALSRRIFERFGWPRVKPTVSRFLANMPSTRLQRRFLERGQECSPDTREEVISACAEWFRSEFPSSDIALIQDRHRSRVFAAYSETDPDGGLKWLREAVERAGSEALLSLDGEPDGSGGWHGRRQIVWLCEHLACFPEYFTDCEAVLFRLALHETEKSIGNNSTHTWRNLFRPLFSGTAVPFEARLASVMGRLARAKLEEVPLVMGAVADMLSTHHVGTAPPRVVGGRLVPEEWRPKTYGELYDVQSLGARSTLNVIRTLPQNEQQQALSLVIDDVGDFLRLGCLHDLQGLLAPENLSDADLRRLRLRLDEQISWLRLNAEDKKVWARKALDQIIDWRKSLEPGSLVSRVMEITGRGYWEHGDRRNPGEGRSVYRTVAAEVLKTLGVLDHLVDWFNGNGPQSSFWFGDALGQLDTGLVASEWMSTRLLQGQCMDLVGGYYAGVSTRCGGLPEYLVGSLEVAASLHPVHACFVTVHSDHSTRGVERLLQALPVAGPNSSRLLFELIRGPWPRILSDRYKVDVLSCLVTLGDQGDSSAVQMALDLASSWERRRPQPLPQPYVEVLIEILNRTLSEGHAIQAYDWEQVVRMLPASHIAEKCNILAGALVADTANKWRLSEDSVKVLVDTAALYPQEVMEAIGQRILDPKRGVIFRVASFPGLFEAIGLEAVRRWVEEAGVQGAIAVARHLQSPAPTDADPAYVPPLTEWFLSHFEAEDQVFRAFRAGRHAFEVRRGSAREHYKGIEKLMAPYLDHPLRRVREWAKYELANAKHEIEWDERDSEDFERE